MDNVILCHRNISPEVVQYIMHAVWAASIVNIAIRSLEYLEEYDYKIKYEEKHISLGQISNLDEYNIHLVHAEDLVIMKRIVRPGNDNKNENRENIFKYDHFNIIFDGTPSFSEAKAFDTLCTKHHFYF